MFGLSLSLYLVTFLDLNYPISFNLCAALKIIYLIYKLSILFSSLLCGWVSSPQWAIPSQADKQLAS